jgi:hypothetical protein
VDLHIFLAVLLAALLHASWNLLVKLDLDRFLALLLISCVMGVMGVAMLAIFPWPDMASAPYFITSGILHTGYNMFLARSYRTGDLSQVYPIGRWRARPSRGLERSASCSSSRASGSPRDPGGNRSGSTA